MNKSKNISIDHIPGREIDAQTDIQSEHENCSVLGLEDLIKYRSLKAPLLSKVAVQQRLFRMTNRNSRLAPTSNQGLALQLTVKNSDNSPKIVKVS